MNGHIKPTSPEKRRHIAIAELLMAASTVISFVVAVAIGDPKIPEAVGD